MTNKGWYAIKPNQPNWKSSQGVMAKLLDCSHEVNEFDLQSRSYVHFRTKNLGKAMNPYIP